MAKKCVLCESEAGYQIKGTGDGYCEPCASEHFGDLSYLESLQE